VCDLAEDQCICIFRIMATGGYDAAYFETQVQGTRQSAAVVVPLVMELLSPRSVCDVGCGTGIWLAVFEEHGVEEVLGLDGDYVRGALQIAPERFVAADLEQGVPAVGSFDLAVSLEVAEHLPRSAAEAFVAGLVGLAPAVLFAAAVPGQGGEGHVNEQWPTYWQELFEQHGYRPLDCVRPRVWSNEEVHFWYRQNTLLFARADVIRSRPALRAARARTAEAPLARVHPDCWRIAVGRPWWRWRKLAAEVEAGRLTPEELHEQMARLLEHFAGTAR
jgi:SAM-dependent methyltransferase